MMATNVKTIFETTLNEAIKAAKNVIDAKDRALAYAEIAKALAMTGLIGTIGEQSAEETVKETAKQAIAEKPPVVNEKAKKEAAPVEKMTEEETEESVWTEADIKAKSKELDFITSIRKAYGEEELVECLDAFSNGALTSVEEDITPDNIDAFVIYLNDLLESDEDEEDEEEAS